MVGDTLFRSGPDGSSKCPVCKGKVRPTALGVFGVPAVPGGACCVATLCSSALTVWEQGLLASLALDPGFSLPPGPQGHPGTCSALCCDYPHPCNHAGATCSGLAPFACPSSSAKAPVHVPSHLAGAICVCPPQGYCRCEHCVGTGYRASWMERPNKCSM